MEDKHVYKRIRANGNTSYHKSFSSMLRKFDRQDLVDLHRLVMKIFEDNTPKDYNLLLLGDLNVMFEPNAEDEIWSNQQDWNLISWKLYKNYRVHTLLMDGTLNCFNMLVEKRYPLIKEILEKMLNWKLEAEAEAESTMAFELLKLSSHRLKNKKMFGYILLVIKMLKGIEVDKVKIDVIAKLPYPTNVKGIRSFLGHAGFYRRFIKDFSMIYKPMTQLLMKDAKFDFFDDCNKAFNELKERLTIAPIVISPDWSIPFELMCDACDLAVVVMLGELDEEEIKDKFSNEHLMILKTNLNDEEPWYADYVNYIVRKVVPLEWTPEKKKWFFQVKNYFWDEPYAFRLCSNNVMRRCVTGREILEILAHCHSGPTGGHHSASVTGPPIRYRQDALKQCNMDLTAAAKNRYMELNELIELRDEAYENTRIYKERTKKWHDFRLCGDKDFKNREKVLLFNSRLRLHPGKLKSKWIGPFILKTMYPYGAVKIIENKGSSFKVNGHRNIKTYPRVWDTTY
nr:hypothetical protein [Tanacetum cinerariifolium]